MEAVFNESQNGQTFVFLTKVGDPVTATLLYDQNPVLMSDSIVFNGGCRQRARAYGYTYGWSGDVYSGMARFNLPTSVTQCVGPAEEEKKRNKYTFLRKDVVAETMYQGRYQYHEIKHYNKLIKQTELKTGIELELIAKPDQQPHLHKIKSNWYFFQYDGSLGNNGWELTTIPLDSKTARNPKTFDVLCNELTKYATSYENRETGLHVHLSREHFFTRQDPATERANIVKAVFLYSYVLQNANNRIFLRCNNNYAERIDIRQARALYDVGVKYINKRYLFDLQNDLYTSLPRSRYAAVNITNPSTIEFRQGKGTIKAESIARMVEYCQLIAKYSSTHKFADMDISKFKAYTSKRASDSINSIIYSI